MTITIFFVSNLLAGRSRTRPGEGEKFMSASNRSGRLLVCCSRVAFSATAMLTFAGQAYAQDDSSGAKGSANTASANAEIIVTARRKEESLQETPIAVSAFSADTLAARQITQTSDLEQITPNLLFKC